MVHILLRAIENCIPTNRFFIGVKTEGYITVLE